MGLLDAVLCVALIDSCAWCPADRVCGQTPRQQRHDSGHRVRQLSPHHSQQHHSARGGGVCRCHACGTLCGSEGWALGPGGRSLRRSLQACG
jgi:hypothetical protein